MLHGTPLSPPAAPPAPPPSVGAGADAPAPPATADGCVRGWARRLGPAGPLAAVMVGLPIAGGLVLVGFLHRLGPWLKSHESPPVAVAAMASVAGLAGFSLVPTYMLEIVCGWAFGATVGLLVAVTGITAAATIGYLISRGLVGVRVREAANDSPRCEAVRRAMLESGAPRAALIVGLLRLAPVVPFGATNLLMASSGCRLAPFAVGTALGSFPRTAAIVFMAAEMSQLDLRQEPGMIVLSVVATLFVVCVIGWLAKRALAQVTDGAGSTERSPNA
jgi:uncharacterized membrane protein YdjX (TVP38/TMEM64 family)